MGLTVAAGIIRRGATRLPDVLRGLEPLAGAGAWLAVVAVSAALLFATFGFLYRFVPAVPTRMGGIWPGALAAAAGFEALQHGFSVYLAFFGHCNKVYGSLGAVIAVMFFVYLASIVFLFGAEIASEYPRLRDGATGAEGSGGSPYTSRRDLRDLRRQLLPAARRPAVPSQGTCRRGWGQFGDASEWDPKLDDPTTTQDDHEQYAEDRGEQGHHAQPHVCPGSQRPGSRRAAVRALSRTPTAEA